MKGMPRPVSLKTDVIKHRNRSKGDKRLKEGQQSRAKGKKSLTPASSTGVRGTSVGSNKQVSPAMEDVEEEEEEDDDQSHDEHTELDQQSPSSLKLSDGSPSTSMAAFPAVGQMNKRPRISLNETSSTCTRSSNTGQEEPAQPSTPREVAAAVALTNASGNNRRSVSVDGRATPSSVSHHAPLPFNLAALFSNIAAREPGRSTPSQLPRTAAPTTASAPPAPTFQPILPHHLFQQQRSSQSPRQRQFQSQPQLHSLMRDGTPQNQQQQQHSLQDQSPRVISRTDPRSLSANPSSAVPKRSPGFSNAVYTAKGDRTPPQLPTVQSSPNGASSNPETSSRFAPASLQPLSTFASSTGPHRSASSDRSNATWSSLLNGPRMLDVTDEERLRQRDRLNQLFAAAGQRLAEGSSGRPNATYSSSPGYKPYEIPSHRSQSRLGQQTADGRVPAVLRSRSSPDASRSDRPSSSASSSSGSNDGAKRGMKGLTSPDLHPYTSPPLTSLADAMMVDEQHGRPKDSLSPAFSLRDAPGAASERRGRSTTRRARDGEPGEVVAHELGALKVRDSSKSSYYRSSLSPAFAERAAASTIKAADLDDGIVRNAVTHRPVSDLRASDSPATTTLPSLSSALSSSNSSRSLSGPQSSSDSRQSAATRHTEAAAMHEDGKHSHSHSPPPMLPPPNSGFDEVARLRTRIQELEFINGLMEGRVAELENARALQPLPHGPGCACRCVGERRE
ncbi:MAG: hypothetical protein CYPHOPRED_005938 [Cyphobasidiales sp. Tagirdzhanova-0007]|nr:MAG: hypothetical protein CYPHOPRED_005938 [Cyphobasidiales sp. Tagirdzhanova-0007]